MSRVIMFQDRFAAKVIAGVKVQTIRLTARCKPGDTLSLRRWTGKPYRSKQEVLQEVVCKAVTAIKINEYGADLGDVFIHCPVTLARDDGFESWHAMRDWFEDVHGLPFSGYVIEWTTPPR